MKHLTTMALAAAGAALAISGAIAEDFPSKTIEVVTHAGAGGGTDRWARVMSSGAFDVFGHGMHVQNRGGAAGTIGWKYMMDQKADGHSILLASPTPVMAALMEKKPPFDPQNVKIAAYYSVMKPTLIAPKDSAYSDWESLVAYLKDDGNKKVTIGGTITQLLGPTSLLAQLGLEKRVILVPYSGTGKAVNDYLGGHIDMAAITTSTAVTVMEKHAVVFNATDTDYPPDAKKIIGDVPNAKTLGLKPFNPPRFIGMHPDTPDEQVAIMSAKLGEMLNSKPVVNMLKKLGEVIVYVPHDEAQKAYSDILVSAKKNVSLFQ